MHIYNYKLSGPTGNGRLWSSCSYMTSTTTGNPTRSLYVYRIIYYKDVRPHYSVCALVTRRPPLSGMVSQNFRFFFFCHKVFFKLFNSHREPPKGKRSKKTFNCSPRWYLPNTDNVQRFHYILSYILYV